jgi:hypothetical protein
LIQRHQEEKRNGNRKFEGSVINWKRFERFITGLGHGGLKEK